MPLINDEFLNFDPLDAAEKLTGKSYKEDEQTSSLGMLLHMHYVQDKRNRLSETLDTYRNQPIDKYIEVINSIGFIKCFEEEFLDYEKQKERLFAFYHPRAIFLVFDTWQNQTVSGGHFHFIYKHHTKDYHLRASGHFDTESYDKGERIFIGSDSDVWDGMKFRIEEMFKNGTCLRWTDKVKFDFWSVHLSSFYRRTKNVDHNNYSKQIVPVLEQETIENWKKLPDKVREIFGKEAVIKK